MATAILSPEKNIVFPFINDVFQANFSTFQQEERKDFSISFLQKQTDFIKMELRNKSLAKKDKLRLLNLLSDFNKILENLMPEEKPIKNTSQNLDEYPPYHLHKKSQSAFGA